MRQIVRLLIVTDDQSETAHGGFLRWVDQDPADAGGDFSRDFHLGEFVRCLSDTSWVGFDLRIVKAHRSPAGHEGFTEAQIKADRGADVIGFRFDQPFTIDRREFTLSDFDVVMFFSLAFNDPDPALAPEAEAIARFMEDGGGFFGTGDHFFLGAPLLGLVPRVRSMRRWWSVTGPNGEPAAPPPFGSTRIDTTRAGADGVTNFEDQSDDVPQEIKPKLYPSGYFFGRIRMLPHPLLCSPDGRITVLPDHMHEGLCEVPDNLAARTFTLDGAEVREYPDYTPADAPAGYVPQPLAPEVVATGTVLEGVTSPELDPAHHGDDIPAEGQEFGVIGAWDGHRVGRGRVVVDSTWHHFFDINLSGDRHLEDNDLPDGQRQMLFGFFVPGADGTRELNDAGRMIMAYFRNLIYWLIPAGRRALTFWPALDKVVRRPQLREELATLAGFDRLTLPHYLHFGQLAEKYFSQARGACATYELLIRLPPDLEFPVRDWLRDNFDPWDPKWKFRGFEKLRREQWLGGLGLAPGMNIIPQLTLGIGVVAAAVTLAKRKRDDDEARVGKLLSTAFADVQRHALGELHKLLAAGADVQSKFARMTQRPPPR